MLKKILVLVFVASTLNLFSQETLIIENFNTISINYGSTLEVVKSGDESLNTKYSNAGLSWTAYSFKNNKTSGLFSSVSLLIPTSDLEIELNDEPYLVVSPLDLGGMYSLKGAIGPGFKFNLADKFNILSGVGINYTITKFGSDTTIMTLGIGYDIAATYNITPSLYLAAGTTGAFDIFSLNGFIDNSDTGLFPNYYISHLEPFIGFGFKK